MKPTFAFLPAAVLLAFAASAQVKITPGPEKISVEINGKPFTEFFMAGDQVVKPYLFPLRAATGTYITRMWPLEKVAEEEKMFEANTIKQDHPHQRGLWFAHDSVNKLDFWNIAPLDQAPYNRPDRGKIVLKAAGKTTSGKNQGSIAATFEWQDKPGATLLTLSLIHISSCGDWQRWNSARRTSLPIARSGPGRGGGEVRETVAIRACHERIRASRCGRDHFRSLHGSGPEPA